MHICLKCKGVGRYGLCDDLACLLWARYRVETEDYDRTIMTLRDEDGDAWPANAHEQSLGARHARGVRERMGLDVIRKPDRIRFWCVSLKAMREFAAAHEFASLEDYQLRALHDVTLRGRGR